MDIGSARYVMTTPQPPAMAADNTEKKHNDYKASLVFDHVNQTICKGHQRTQLSPKACAVLNFLLAHPNTLISKDNLLDAVWPDVCVGDAVLKNRICELRQILDDDPAKPQFIETVHRRGYRFIGNLPSCETAANAPVLDPLIPAAHRSGWQQLDTS